MSANALLVELLEIFGRGVLLLGLAFVVSLTLRKRSAGFVSCYWRAAIVAVLLLPAVPTLWTLRQGIEEPPIRVVETATTVTPSADGNLRSDATAPLASSVPASSGNRPL